MGIKTNIHKLAALTCRAKQIATEMRQITEDQSLLDTADDYALELDDHLKRKIDEMEVTLP